MLTRDPVSAHLAALGRSLHGPSALRGSMLREARDGLDDAAAAYRDAGVEPGRAAALAVRDFGPVAGVAPLLQAELAAAQGKRTALLLAVAFPALMLGWDQVWSGGSEWGGAATPAVRVLAVAQDVSSVAIAVVAVGLLVLGLRRTADPRRMAGGTGLAALAAVLLSGGTAVAMNVADPADAWAQFTGRPTFTAAYLVSVVVLVVVGASAVRTVRAARRREGATS